MYVYTQIDILTTTTTKTKTTHTLLTVQYFFHDFLHLLNFCQIVLISYTESIILTLTSSGMSSNRRNRLLKSHPRRCRRRRHHFFYIYNLLSTTVASSYIKININNEQFRSNSIDVSRTPVFIHFLRGQRRFWLDHTSTYLDTRDGDVRSDIVNQLTD